MKHIRLFEELEGKFYWKIETKYLENSLFKLPKITEEDRKYLMEDFKKEETHYPYSPDEMIITYDNTYDDNIWGWTFYWNEPQLIRNNYKYQGKIELEDHEKAAINYNL
jgi:hypothetical protein